MDYMIIVWLIAVIGFTLIEAFTVQLTCIWFAAASFAALFFAVFNASLRVQLIVFIVSATVELIFARPVIRKLTRPSHKPTNADRALGATAIVLEQIDNANAKGQVKVNNQVWSARSSNGDTIPKGATVVVRYIEGVKLIVDPKETKQNNKETAECTH